VTEPKSIQPITINLLSQDEFSQSAIGKVMLWALSIGRYIVVFTELIVILSFLSRFKLDRDLTDLNEAIIRQKAIILSYGNLENDFRFAQSQLEIIKNAYQTLQPDQYISLLGRATPYDVKLNQLQVKDQTLRISATSVSPQGFIRFITNLLHSDLIAGVAVNQLASKDQGLTIVFEVTCRLARP